MTFTTPQHSAYRYIQQYQGRFIVAENVGTTVDDINHINSQTLHVIGFFDQEPSSGDSSAVNAYGVFCCLKAAVEHRLG